MRILMIIGCLLVLIGVTGVVSGGITYTRHRKTADFGPLNFTYEKKEKIAVHPAVGAVVLASGVVVCAVGFKKR